MSLRLTFPLMPLSPASPLSTFMSSGDTGGPVNLMFMRLWIRGYLQAHEAY